jgi:hypothetical protein
MNITVTRTGGFGGLKVERSVDTDGRADAAEWEELVKTAGFDALPASPPQPDRFTYRIDVDGRTVTVGERDLTGPLHTLVQRVLSADR